MCITRIINHWTLITLGLGLFFVASGFELSTAYNYKSNVVH